MASITPAAVLLISAVLCRTDQLVGLDLRRGNLVARLQVGQGAPASLINWAPGVRATAAALVDGPPRLCPMSIMWVEAESVDAAQCRNLS